MSDEPSPSPSMPRLFLTLFGIVIFIMGCLVGLKAWGSEVLAQPVTEEAKKASERPGIDPVAFLLVWKHDCIIHNRDGDHKGTAKGFGSCFAVDSTHVLTARHCCYDDGHKQIIRVVVSGVEYPLEVIKEDANLDLALCEVKGVILKTNEIALTELNTNLPIVLIGFPRGEAKSSKAVFVSRYWLGSAKDVLNVPFDHGCSGCPVIQDGKVFGIAISGIPKDGDLDKARALYLPASVLAWFLKE